MNVSDLQKVIYTYKLYLKRRDLSDNTIERYVNDLKILIKNENTSDEINTAFMNRRINELLSDHKISSVNSYIITYNAFFKWCKMPIHLDALPTQKVTSIQNIITKEDYLYLMEYASQNNKDKAYAIMFLLANTGIRVGEIKYVTVESITQKGTWIKNKGRFRYVCFSNKLCEELYLYCTKKGIHEGPIFLGRNKTTPMSEKGIWAMLKRLAREANIDDQLIYPHSFRHFFAKLYLKESGNIADLADILGHNNIETTRIYTRTSIEEKRQIMEKIVID